MPISSTFLRISRAWWSTRSWALGKIYQWGTDYVRESEEDHSRHDVRGLSKRCCTAGGERLPSQLHLPRCGSFSILWPCLLSLAISNTWKHYPTAFRRKAVNEPRFFHPSSVSVSNVNANLPEIEASKFPKTLLDEWSSPLPFPSLSKSLRKKNTIYQTPFPLNFILISPLLLKSYLSQLKVLLNKLKLAILSILLEAEIKICSMHFDCSGHKEAFWEVHYCHVLRETIIFGTIFIKRLHALSHPSASMCSTFNSGSRVWEEAVLVKPEGHREGGHDGRQTFSACLKSP